MRLKSRADAVDAAAGARRAGLTGGEHVGDVNPRPRRKDVCGGWYVQGGRRKQQKELRLREHLPYQVTTTPLTPTLACSTASICAHD